MLVLLGACHRTADATGAASPSEFSAGVPADQVANKDLAGALETARSYFSRHSTFTGFSAVQAEVMDKYRAWRGDAGASAGVITINYAHGGALIMSTASSSGARFCVAVQAGNNVSHGTRDAAGARDPTLCAGVSASSTP
jgi:hypothetical protein